MMLAFPRKQIVTTQIVARSGEKWVFRYPACEYRTAMKQAFKYALDPTCNFDFYDAASAQSRIRADVGVIA